jgi:hypothetical protein
MLDLLDKVNDSVETGTRGISIIDELFKRCSTGIPAVRELWMRLVTRVNAFHNMEILTQ